MRLSQQRQLPRQRVRVPRLRTPPLPVRPRQDPARRRLRRHPIESLQRSLAIDVQCVQFIAFPLITFDQPLPRGPVLNWACFSGAKTADLPSVDEQGPCEITTSGRAALFRALTRLQLARGSVVLVPTYHCPTMVAPIVHAGLTPVFYAIGEDGLPQLHSIQIEASFKPQAMIVAHYFGIAQSLQIGRASCRERV